MTTQAGDAVFIRGLEFEGNHGHSAAERRGTRRFHVNLIPSLSSSYQMDIVYYKIRSVGLPD